MRTGLFLIAAMACGHAPRQAAPGVAAGEVVPVYREPMHREVFHSPLVRQGPRIRVYQITLAPGAATEAHTHATPGLTVLGTGGALLEDGSPGASGGSGAGSWSWREAPYRHVLRNDGPTPMVIFEIDWR